MGVTVGVGVPLPVGVTDALTLGEAELLGIRDTELEGELVGVTLVVGGLDWLCVALALFEGEVEGDDEGVEGGVTLLDVDGADEKELVGLPLIEGVTWAVTLGVTLAVTEGVTAALLLGVWLGLVVAVTEGVTLVVGALDGEADTPGTDVGVKKTPSSAASTGGAMPNGCPPSPCPRVPRMGAKGLAWHMPRRMLVQSPISIPRPFLLTLPQ